MSLGCARMYVVLSCLSGGCVASRVTAARAPDPGCWLRIAGLLPSRRVLTPVALALWPAPSRLGFRELMRERELSGGAGVTRVTGGTAIRISVRSLSLPGHVSIDLSARASYRTKPRASAVASAVASSPGHTPHTMPRLAPAR